MVARCGSPGDAGSSMNELHDPSHWRPSRPTTPSPPPSPLRMLMLIGLPQWHAQRFTIPLGYHPFMLRSPQHNRAVLSVVFLRILPYSLYSTRVRTSIFT